MCFMALPPADLVKSSQQICGSCSRRGLGEWGGVGRLEGMHILHPPLSHPAGLKNPETILELGAPLSLSPTPSLELLPAGTLQGLGFCWGPR